MAGALKSKPDAPDDTAAEAATSPPLSVRPRPDDEDDDEDAVDEEFEAD